MPKAERELIAVDGDLMFVVGHERKRIRVSSGILSAASPVLKTMIMDRSCQCSLCQLGQMHVGRIVINLPDDDATAMSQLCRLLHLKQPVGLQSDSPTEEFLAFGAIVDKYNCSEQLVLQSRGLILHWLNQNDFVDDEVQIWNMIVASYLLRERHSFRRTTAMLICSTHKPLLTLRKTPAARLLPSSALVLSTLSDARHFSHDEIFHCHMKLGSHCDRHTRTNQDQKLDEFATEVSHYTARWPPMFEDRSINTMLKKLETLDGLEVACTECEWKTKLNFHDIREDNGERSGLCLWCVLDDQGGDFDWYMCRGHTDWMPEIHASSRLDGNASL